MAAMARTVTEMPLDELPVGAPWGTMPPELLRVSPLPHATPLQHRHGLTPPPPAPASLPASTPQAIASRLPQRDLRSARSTCTSWLCMVQGLEQKAWEVSGPDLSDVEGWAQDVAALSALAPNIHHVQLTLAAMGALQLDRWLVTLQRVRRWGHPCMPGSTDCAARIVLQETHSLGSRVVHHRCLPFLHAVDFLESAVPNA
jgi:hypothetical protein